MNLPTRQAESLRGDNNNSGGGGALRGTFDAAPAHSFTVGEIGFGPTWSAEDSMAASIIRLEQENEELRAEVALLKQGMTLLAEERDEARVQYRSTHALAESLVKSIGELRAERAEWRQCAQKLCEAACYLEPALLYDDPQGGFTNQREAVREFIRLKEGK